MQFIKIVLVGIGQIFLQENGLSGLIICIAMFFSHWTLSVGCLLGSLIGTATAIKLNYPQNEIKQGLYGFNASLAFMCVMFTFGLTDISITIFILGALSAVISTLIMRELTKRNLVAYTFPFVFTCWFLCWGIAKIELFGLLQTSPSLLDHTSTVDSMTATIISPLMAHALFNIEPNQLANGIYSFSAILVACAFAGERLRDFMYILIGIFLAILVQFSVAKVGIAPYTIGFIVAAWVLLWLKDKIDDKKLSSEKLSNLLNP